MNVFQNFKEPAQSNSNLKYSQGSINISLSENSSQLFLRFISLPKYKQTTVQSPALRQVCIGIFILTKKALGKLMPSAGFVLQQLLCGGLGLIS